MFYFERTRKLTLILLFTKYGKKAEHILEFTREFKYSMKMSFYRVIKYLTVKWSGLVRFSIHAGIESPHKRSPDCDLNILKP